MTRISHFNWRFCLIAVTVTALLSLTVSFALRSASSAHAASWRVLPNSLAPALAHASALHATSTSGQLQLTISLQLRNEAALEALLAAQDNPKSALYHHYLTPQEFVAQFGPTQSAVNQVVAFAQSEGIHVTSVSSNHLLIDATTSVAVAERAFGVSIEDYNLDGRVVYSPTTDPAIPDSLAGVIQSISGLDNVAHYHSLDTLTPRVPALGPDGGYTPTELRTAYDISSLISGGGDGTGQTVAIFELNGYRASDVNEYLSYYGLGSARYSNVLVDGASATGTGGGAVEVELDMEDISAIAPEATQNIYIGPNTNQGVNDTYNKIVTNDTAKVTSTSWGECEADSGSSELSALDTIFTEGAAQGQAFFAASGDSGAYDCGGSALGVDSPASDPHVVGVGGTELTTASGGVYTSEAAWSESAYAEGSGGGLSSYFSRPSYQTGTNLTSTHREVPDVSADAYPSTGYSVYCTVSRSYCGSGWTVIGGTSAAAPLWAGIALDTNEYLSGLGDATFGSASADLYTLYNTTPTYTPYHDVTTGNNLYYSATTGYDLATGIGTPYAWNIARDLA